MKEDKKLFEFVIAIACLKNMFTMNCMSSFPRHVCFIISDLI